MPYATNQGVRLYYEVIGQGSPIILIHGAFSGLEDWKEFGYVERLQQDYQLILLDVRGQGASDKPHSPEAYSLKLLIDDIAFILDELNLNQAHYLGYSMGGWIGFGMAKFAPNRLYSLMIGGAHPYARNREHVRRRYSQTREEWEAQIESNTEMPPALKARVLKNDLQALLAAAQDRADISDVLPTISVPCLVYAGEADEAVYRQAKQCVSQITNVTFFSLPGLTHGNAYLRSDLILPHIIKFLRSVDSP
ncbi:alpha/beta fold hydrolase [Chloroflexi bacterium TSY]|nr:alpha/beta fold hydrolase [Chloroflexi bacterium TSY]